MKALLIAILVLLALPVKVGAEGLVDPTRPYGATAGVAYDPVAHGPVLQSTMVSPLRKSAMISGKRVRIGDAYEGAVITEITSYEVRMTKAGRETTLRLQPKMAKQKGVVQ